MSGEIIGSAAWTEPLAGSDISGIQTTAYPRSDKYIVNGTKTWAANGSVADIALIAAKIDQTGIDKNNLALFLVEKKNSCFETIETPKMGLKALSTAKLVLKDFPVTKDNILIIHEELENRHDWRSFLQKEEKCLTAAISLGIAEASLEAAVSYSKQRMQFGKRLAEFQMIQKMIAEMAVSLYAAKFLTFRALKMLDEGVPCYKEIIMAKTFAAQTAVEAASKAIHIHGAYGYSDELPVERYYRDANCFAILDKSTELQELEIAKEVLGFK